MANRPLATPPRTQHNTTHGWRWGRPPRQSATMTGKPDLVARSLDQSRSLGRHAGSSASLKTRVVYILRSKTSPLQTIPSPTHSRQRNQACCWLFTLFLVLTSDFGDFCAWLSGLKSISTRSSFEGDPACAAAAPPPRSLSI